MKKLSLTIAAIILVVVSASSLISCTDQGELGRQAAEEFCNCMKENSFSKCNDEFKSRYKRNTSDDFISSFNAEGAKCGVSASKVTQ